MMIAMILEISLFREKVVAFTGSMMVSHCMHPFIMCYFSPEVNLGGHGTFHTAMMTMEKTVKEIILAHKENEQSLNGNIMHIVFFPGEMKP
jgi:hypothetical protein